MRSFLTNITTYRRIEIDFDYNTVYLRMEGSKKEDGIVCKKDDIPTLIKELAWAADVSFEQIAMAMGINIGENRE